MASKTQSVAHKEWVVKIDRDAKRHVIKVWVECPGTDRQLDLTNPAGFYSDFTYKFFAQTLDGITTQWLWYRCDQCDQHFINLETGSHYGTPAPTDYYGNLMHHSFCWKWFCLNAEGTLAAVAGKNWDDSDEPCEFRFFDFHNLRSGCPQIEFKAHPDYRLERVESATYNWVDNTFHFAQELTGWMLHLKLYGDDTELLWGNHCKNIFKYKLAYKLVLAYDGKRMIYEHIEPEPHYAELISRSSHNKLDR